MAHLLDDDVKLPSKMWISTQGYPMIRVDGSDVAVHRWLLGLRRGDKRQGDHKNRNKRDNRRHNLRIASQAENLVNKGRKKTNTSGYIGVSKTAHGKYCARIGVDKKVIRLGNYVTAIEAATIYNTACKKYRGEFAVINLGA